MRGVNLLDRLMIKNDYDDTESMLKRVDERLSAS
jgi:hypothetical protein